MQYFFDMIKVGFISTATLRLFKDIPFNEKLNAF
jgi:hypothetical protein